MRSTMTREELIASAGRLATFKRSTVLQLDSRIAYRLRLDVLGDSLSKALSTEDFVDMSDFGSSALEELFDVVLRGELDLPTQNDESPPAVDESGVPIEVAPEDVTPVKVKNLQWATPLKAASIEPSVPRSSHLVIETDVFHKGGLGGVVPILGRTGSGKSEYMRSQHPDAVLIRWAEPYEKFDIGEGAVHVDSLSHLIGAGIIVAASGRVAFWDSLSYALYNLVGAALPGGIVATAVTALTGINNLVARVGGIAAISFNAMLNDEAMTSFAEEMAGRVTGLILLRDGVPVYRTFRTTDKRFFSHATGPHHEDMSSVPRLERVPLVPDEDATSSKDVKGLGIDYGDAGNDATPVRRVGAGFFSLNNDL